MELYIIQISLATIVAMFCVSLPFRIVLMVRDTPIDILKKWKWKKLF